MAPTFPLASPPATRTVPCCSYCGELVEPGASCEEHPTEALTTVTLDRSWLAPAEIAHSETLTPTQIDTVRAWLDSITARGSELQPFERDLLAACDRTDGAARSWVAAAFNTLQRGA